MALPEVRAGTTATYGVVEAQMLTDAQLEMRKTGISATEISAVVGLNPYLDTQRLWGLKMGLLESEPETAAQRAGRHLEGAVAAWYEEETGTKLLGDGKETLRHPDPDLSWVLATPDRWTLDASGRVVRLIEIKTAGFGALDEWGFEPDAIPRHYLIQVTWQMGVVGVQECDVAALLMGRDFRIYPQRFDADLFAMLVEAGRSFWFDHVVTGEPPPLAPGPGARALLHGRYPTVRGSMRSAPRSAEAWAHQYLDARDGIKVLKDLQEEAQINLCAAIGDAMGFESGTWSATWKAAAGRPNWKNIAEELAGGRVSRELVQRHTPSPTRTFRCRRRDELEEDE